MGDVCKSDGCEMLVSIKGGKEMARRNYNKKVACMTHESGADCASLKGYIVLSPSACAADGALLASRVGCKFEKTVKIRIDIRDAKTPDPDHWNFRPESAYVVSAWAGDVQLHLGSVVAAVMKIGGKAAHAELNGFVINPKRIMKIIVALRLYDIVKGRNVNIENLIGLQYSRLELVDIGDMRKINRCVGIVDTRSDVTLQFLKDYHRVRKAMDFDAIEVVLEKTHKFSYEEAVLMVERELKVCRLVARKLLQEDQHWSDYQYKAGKVIEVGNRMYEVIPYRLALISLYNRISHLGYDKLYCTDGIIIAGDNKVKLFGIAVCISNTDKSNAE